MCIAVRNVVSAAVLCILSLHANATLIANGFEWLELTENQGISVAAMTASNLNGWGSSGYRYATIAEVEELWLGLGWDGTENVISAINGAPAADLLATLGCTINCAVVSRSGWGWAEGGLNAPFYELVTTLSAGNFGCLAVQDCTTDATQLQQFVGHWLVRTVASTPVPEPGSLSVLGAGLFWLGLIRRR